ncbi:MAG TPA: Do family serine endopeptidase [Nitrospiraceae bacterium]|nr:Do family serine endopeptidase [Nitrospiraceae bacterium]
MTKHAGQLPAATLVVILMLGTIAAQPVAGADKPAPGLQSSASDLQAQIKVTAAKVLPAVVNISSTMLVRDQPLNADGLPFGMLQELPPHRQYGQGSGVIISADGYIITNDHVVADAVDVDVLLSDRRQFKGRVVATDPKTDVAVVKIEATGLSTVHWGDSSHLVVGDFILAIGNPLGLNQTVTFGIVSAVGRADVGVADFEDFIQIDASINPGNSGGALVNIKGELVGINTAIASTTGGSVGVGFAIPSNMAREAMQSLLKTGRVVRGFLGASMQDVTPQLGKLFKLPGVKGAIITDLLPKGSAEKAGLRRGDVIVRYDGRDVLDSGRLRNWIAGAPTGSKHKLDVIRDGKAVQAELVVQEAPRERARRAPSPAREATHPLNGVLVDEITPALGRQLGLGSITGLVVSTVEEGSLAEAAGLAPGDLIVEVNHHPVTDLVSFNKLMEPVKPKDPLLLLVNRQNSFLYVPIEGQ